MKLHYFNKAYQYFYLFLFLSNFAFGEENSSKSDTLNDVLLDFYHFEFNTFSQASIYSIDIDYLVIDSYYNWWNLLIDPNEQRYRDNININFKKIQTLWDNKELNNPHKYYCATIIALFKLRTDILYGEKVASISAMKLVIGFIKPILREERLTDETKLIVGLYLYVAGQIQKDKTLFSPYMWVIPLGNIQKGNDLLEQCLSSQNNIVKIEANYFLYKINFEIIKDYEKANLYIENLVLCFPENPIYLIEKYKTLSKLMKYTEQTKKDFVENISKSKCLNGKQKTFLLNSINF